MNDGCQQVSNGVTGQSQTFGAAKRVKQQQRTELLRGDNWDGNSWFLYSTHRKAHGQFLRIFPRRWWGSNLLFVGSRGFITLYSEISRTPSG
ncbi:hypothetical protein ASPVEDRAFT_42463 [Aspergillus versicolor CBS 583.65]|uniref:Uncharacterized protein n=1 Tax=Aspergillus versicolor CBS 583.65 TaxID=1036611 RepID=A0A1L9PN74_ASPVE|nr:uncharacterized protein ASPVEDRAFT_42463 [Aspergillus versicolor CBS 583.65]OJJ02932.1 hypothetical protein ASPVEDRAFT_42463 [Aspergillus versicolor CBS 583.65]